MMDEGTENAFEFSLTYDLIKEGEPTWDNLWIFMAKAIVVDGIILPANVSRKRLDYLMSCEKINQTVRNCGRRKDSMAKINQTGHTTQRMGDRVRKSRYQGK
jgi:hypothetical protein